MSFKCKDLHRFIENSAIKFCAPILSMQADVVFCYTVVNV